MKKVQIAIIGCGRVAHHHAKMLIGLDDVELSCVCDLKDDRAEELGNMYKKPWYKNYHEMLNKEIVDAVVIATPSGMHPFHAMDIIKHHRKHLIIEKPIVLRPNDAKKLQFQAKNAGIKIFPIYQNRYNKAVQWVKRTLDDGNLGKILMSSVRLHWCRPQAYYDRDPWRGTWALDGGALTNQGIHYLDLLQWLAGDVVTVFALKKTQLVNVEVEDMVTGCLEFHNGALGTLEITTAARPKDYEASITLLGEKGTAILAGISANKLVEFTPNPKICSEVTEEFPTVYGFGHRVLLQKVARDLLGKESYPISLQEATKAINLLNKIYHSTEKNKKVLCINNSLKSSVLGRRNNKLENLYKTKNKIC